MLSEEDKYLFDLNGYIVIKGVFSPEEVAAANDAITNHMPSANERIDDAIRNTKRGTGMGGNGKDGRIDLGGVLQWGEQSKFFHSVLDHPKLVPYYNEFCGKGYRMDHMPFCIVQNKGSEGFNLHGGTIDVSSGEYNHFLAYTYNHGQIRSNLLAVAVALCPHPEGGGGFCVVKGSHKSNFKAPPAMIQGDAYREHVQQVVSDPGDVIIWSEGTVHGALPWMNDHQRRVALFRFAPSTCAYGRSYMEEGNPMWPEGCYDGMTERQKAVLQPPFNTRLDRVQLDDEGGTHVESRSKAKKEFDKKVFGTSYF
ncbi:hypothetical protein TrCOL_g8501 [Triparma columacea]|uniref:Phytanoyl-CoA dioxygenase family protein n=1 Tax=Triparma columacea TaxID=722753 RepID=A0A9W7FYK0_9STRA|nr:hypothetical protein TrCOL_g8501 [Triparma columacea]